MLPCVTHSMFQMLVVLASLLSLAGAEAVCRPRPLGLMDHTIRDWQLAASSVVSRAEDPDCAVKHARLFAEGGKAWCPEQRRENEWILVDLGVQSEIAAIMTQVQGGIYQRHVGQLVMLGSREERSPVLGDSLPHLLQRGRLQVGVGQGHLRR